MQEQTLDGLDLAIILVIGEHRATGDYGRMIEGQIGHALTFAGFPDDPPETGRRLARLVALGYVDQRPTPKGLVQTPPNPVYALTAAGTQIAGRGWTQPGIAEARHAGPPVGA